MENNQKKKKYITESLCCTAETNAILQINCTLRQCVYIQEAGEKGMTEDEMVGWHHQFDGHESEQAPGAGDRQKGLACCSPGGHKELDTTEQLN